MMSPLYLLNVTRPYIAGFPGLDNPFSPRRLFMRQIIAPLLRMLEKMHAFMLLHRDIKPENIFLSGALEVVPWWLPACRLAALPGQGRTEPSQG